jgi:hypothetical protein
MGVRRGRGPGGGMGRSGGGIRDHGALAAPIESGREADRGSARRSGNQADEKGFARCEGRVDGRACRLENAPSFELAACSGCVFGLLRCSNCKL